MGSVAEKIYNLAPVWLQTAALNYHAYKIRWHRYGRGYRKVLLLLEKFESMDRDLIKEYQVQKARRIIEVAHRKCPYYREKFAEQGFQPNDLKIIEDIKQLPLLTKEDIRKSHDSLMSSLRPQLSWLHGHTSGTTGSPLEMWYDRQMCNLNNAVDRQQKKWGGVGNRDWIGVFLGQMIVPTTMSELPYWRSDFAQRQVWYSSLHLSDDTLGYYVDDIKQKKLRFLEGYPSTLYILARYINQCSLVIHMRAVFSSSETLHQIQREEIEKAFRCKLFDFYGLAERVIFATECEMHDGKHLNEMFGYTEILDHKGDEVPEGEVGHLVGTSLQNEAMPMLRYKTGDMSALIKGACSCGRTWRKIQNVTTKQEELICTPDGRYISPSVLTHPFKPFSQIRISQIVQEKTDFVMVKVVADKTFSERDKSTLQSELVKRLGTDMEVKIVMVDSIPSEKSGKFRWVINNAVK